MTLGTRNTYCIRTKGPSPSFPLKPCPTLQVSTHFNSFQIPLLSSQQPLPPLHSSDLFQGDRKGKLKKG